MAESEYIKYISHREIKQKVEWIDVDYEGRLIIPPDVAREMGIVPGAQLRIEPATNGLRLHRPVTHLNKVYVEPTNACNLDCLTCFRQGWDDKLGKMTEKTFQRVLDGIQEFDPMPTLYFGGIGEPLANKRTIEWVARAKAIGARVEMISNGTLLDEKRLRLLVEAGLDLLWVSIDGAHPENYADIRLGAELPKVIENLTLLRKIRKGGHFPKPELGIAFVAMRRNIGDLPDVLKIGQKLGAKYFSVSNVLPVTKELQEEMLYKRAITDLTYTPSDSVPHLSLPKMDFTEWTKEALNKAFQAGYNVSYAGNNWGGSNDVCGYIESGTMSVGWSGDVSPCWPLMHTHHSYLHGKKRINYRHVVGNVKERSVHDLWFDPEYVAYRQRVHSFSFAPCTFCGGCEMSEANLEDCLSNVFPACGGCLWAQGVIQCP